MAHFAKLNENNQVEQIIVVNNNELIDENEIEQEQKGIEFCQNLFGGTWIQTSYNGNFRKNFAGLGYTYDAVRDAFIPVKPFDSWVLNEDTCLWQAPVDMPMDGNYYIWDENTTTWILQE